MEINNENDVASNIDIICQTSPMAYFDEVIGHIEDIVMSEDFQSLHNSFFERYWQKIENTEENRHEYMDIFHEYTETFEHFFIDELTRRMKCFNMQRFAELLSQNQCFHDTANYSEIFELLHSFSDFQVFKQSMLDYRFKKEGNLQHLDFDILVTKPLCKNSSAANGNEIDITNQLGTRNE